MLAYWCEPGGHDCLADEWIVFRYSARYFRGKYSLRQMTCVASGKSVFWRGASFRRFIVISGAGLGRGCMVIEYGDCRTINGGDICEGGRGLSGSSISTFYGG